MSIRIQDIAREANVSVSTVSRVLNGQPGVAKETHKRIRQIIDKLGYSSSLAAKSMRGRTNVIGVVTFHLSLPFNLEVIRGIDQMVQKHGYDLMIYTSYRSNHLDDPARERKVVAQLNGSIVDGVIVITPMTSNLPAHYPLVVIGPCDEDSFPSVLAANREGAAEAVEYLIVLGHRRIGFIGGEPALVSARQRYQGYVDAHEKAGLCICPELLAEGNFLRDGAVVGARKLLSLPEPPTAIMAANDETAFAVLEVAQDLGIRVPEDLSLVGFDNTPASALTAPALTTVEQGLAQMGEAGAGLLIRMLSGEHVESGPYTLPARLVVRDTCRALA